MPAKPIVPREIIHKGRRVWVVHVPRALNGGKQRRIFRPTQAKAQKVADQLDSIRLDMLAGFELLSPPERADLYRIVQLCGNVQEVRRLVDFALAHNPKQTTLVKDLCDACMESKRAAKLSEKYLSDSFEPSLKKFRLQFGERQAHAISAPEIQDWLGLLNVKSEARWNHLKNIRTLFNFALKRKLVHHNPAAGVETPKISRKAPCILTVGEAEKLMRSLESNDPGLIRVVAMVLFGGLRPEAEALQVREKHVNGDVIDLPAADTKNNHRRLVEFKHAPTLKAWWDCGGELPPSNWHRRLAEVRRLAGLSHWGHDILRHSFVSYAVPIHGVAQAALMADHSESVLKRHYRALVLRDDAERFWGILPKKIEKSIH